MGSSAPITGYCVHLLHGLHTPTCILLVPLTWHRRQHWHLQIYGTHDVKVFWDRRNAKAVAECWLRVRVHELGKFQMNLLRVELAPTALKALQPLWTVWRKLQLHLVVIWTWMWNVFCEMKDFQKLLATSQVLDIFVWTRSFCDCLTFWDVVSY